MSTFWKEKSVERVSSICYEDIKAVSPRSLLPSIMRAKKRYQMVCNYIADKIIPFGRQMESIVEYRLPESLRSAVIRNMLVQVKCVADIIRTNISNESGLISQSLVRMV